MQNEALVVINIGGSTNQSQAVHQRKALSFAAQCKRQNAAEPMGQLPLRDGMVFGTQQSRIVHRMNFLVATLQELGDGQRVFATPLDRKSTRLNSSHLG